MHILKLRIATRKSPLALVQAHFVEKKLQQYYPGLSIELVEITTTGDKIQDRSLAAIGGKGLFVKALEEAMLRGEADFAVHSLKDVPPELPQGFVLAAIGERESPYDVLVSNHYDSLNELPKGAKVGTCSFRRAAQLLHIRPDLEVQDIRGNVDSRLKKLDEGQFEALVLAEAGLRRLGLTQRIKQRLDSDLLPSVGQGALALECLSNNRAVIEMLQKFNHQPTRFCIEAERAMNRGLQASCFSPVGSFAEIKNHELVLKGLVASKEGKVVIRTTQTGKPEQAEKIGQLAAEDLLVQGAAKYLS
ncbi:MAG: porphobilinogen deaminase [Gammaproteobacteria bacterium]|jgi:hydroxymethylbilane synthase|nr:porphobilinogen deaminase [Gammaproteobacteria bacterium]